MSAERSRDEYPGQLEGSTVSALERAIKLLAPGASHRAVALELLDNKASRHTVKAWRLGWRMAPDWVLDMLRAKLEINTKPRLEVLAMLERKPTRVDRGAIGKQALNRWRAAQALKKQSPSR